MATCLEDNRAQALRVGYEATDWVRKPDYAQYVDALSDWNVRAMTRDGVIIGAAYTLGPEFHVSILPEWRGRWATRGILAQLIQEPLSVTRVTQGHERVYGFLERLGFEHRGDGLFVRELVHGN